MFKKLFLLSALLLLSACHAEETVVQTDYQASNVGIVVAEQYAQARTMDTAVQGSVKGLFLAESFSKPLYPQSLALEKGVIASHNYAVLSLDSNDSIVILNEILQVLSLDVQEEIQQAQNRGIALQKHIDFLYDLQEKAQNNLRDVQVAIADTNAEFSDASIKASNYQEQFTASINSLAAAEVQDSLENFKAEKQKEVDTRADLGLLLAVEERFEYYLPYLAQRIQNIENNRTNIILGARCQ